MIGQFNNTQTKYILVLVERMVKEEIDTVDNDIAGKTAETSIGLLTNHYKLATE